MKLWATSCLHLSPEKSKDVIDNLTDQVRREVSDGDTILLLGDIIDSEQPDMVGYYLTWLDTLFAHCSVLFVPGNHDKWYPNVKTSDRWSNLADLSLVYRYHGTTKVPYMVTFPGVNYEGPSWARHHDEEEMDLNPVVEQIYAARPRVVATHYPFWWADETVDSMLDVAIYTSGVKKVVFGHLHSVADWLDACSTSPLPDVDLYYVAAVGREQPLTLVDWINE